MIPPLQMLTVSSYGSNDANHDSPSVDDDTDIDADTDIDPDNDTAIRINQSMVKLMQESHYCIEVDSNGQVSNYTPSFVTGTGTGTGTSYGTAYVNMNVTAAPHNIKTRNKLNPSSKNQTSWFNFNMNHLLKSLLCIERDGCCGSLDYSQSAHIASASSSVASSNDISNKLSQAHENGRYSFWSPSSSSNNSNGNARIHANTHDDAHANLDNPHSKHVMSKEERFYTNRWNGHLPLAAMDAAAIAIQRNTVKQHRIMRARGMKFTHIRPRTAAVARIKRNSPTAEIHKFDIATAVVVTE